MPQDLVEKALASHANAWDHRYGDLVDASRPAVHPLAFVFEGKAEAEVRRASAALSKAGYHVFDVEQQRRLFRTRWQVIATTDPLPFTREISEDWVRRTAVLLQDHDVTLKIWSPVERTGA